MHIQFAIMKKNEPGGCRDGGEELHKSCLLRHGVQAEGAEIQVSFGGQVLLKRTDEDHAVYESFV